MQMFAAIKTNIFIISKGMHIQYHYFFHVGDLGKKRKKEQQVVSK